MRIALLIIVLLPLLPLSLAAQGGTSVLDIMNKGRTPREEQRLVIVEDPAIDTLINRHIMANMLKRGIDGWRIQIYRGGHRTASEDANRVRARFMGEYPDIKTYLTFDRPNWFKVKVGDFRTREEAATVFYDIVQKYPEAYLIRDVIDFKSSAK
jgi:hypothetical protein